MLKYRQVIKYLLFSGTLVLSSVTFSLFLSDWVLGFLSFPSEMVSHPANHEEFRQNLEFEYIFRTNSQGLRYHEVSAEKPANAHRVFVSGDSFVEGYGIGEGDRFSDLLEEHFQSRDTSVLFINGGLSGAGPLQYGRLFLKTGLEYRPDAVLICVFVNDVANTPEILPPAPFSAAPYTPGIRKVAYYLWPHVYTQLKSLYLQRSQQSRTKTTDFIMTITKQARRRNIPQPQIKLWQESLPPKLVSAVNQLKFNGGILSHGLLYPEYWRDSIDISSIRANDKWNNMTTVLARILERSKHIGIETAVILIPTPLQYDPTSHGETNPEIVAGVETKEIWLSEETEIQKRMRHWASSEGVSFLDLTPVFRQAIQSNESLTYKLDGHWNSLGHRIAAEAIASWLEDQQVFSFMGGKSPTEP